MNPLEPPADAADLYRAIDAHVELALLVVQLELPNPDVLVEARRRHHGVERVHVDAHVADVAGPLKPTKKTSL